MAPQNSWHRVFSGAIPEIAAAASWIESIATDLDLPGRLVFDMQICLEELMSNIVRHGGVHSSSTAYLPQTDPTNPLLISITIDALADRMIMTVEDNGRPFDVAQAPAKRVDRLLEQVQPGGLGIQLIRSFASNLEYRRTEQGNRVIVEFRR
jgi:serine/threonine-protein kinase RsbW